MLYKVIAIVSVAPAWVGYVGHSAKQPFEASDMPQQKNHSIPSMQLWNITWAIKGRLSPNGSDVTYKRRFGEMSKQLFLGS